MKIFGGILGTILAVVLLVVAYGALIEPRFILDVEEEVAPIPNLPPEWEGQTVAVLADFQIGMWFANEGMVRRAVNEAIERRPAAILLVGDFLYHPDPQPTDLVAEVMELLQPLVDSAIPTYAVLGNHDWALDVEDGTINREAARQMRDALEGAGIRVLDNQAVPLERDAGVSPAGSTPLYLVGIGSAWAETDEPAQAVAEVPAGAPRLVFMHNPNSFEEIPAGAAPLAIAAHTHGGQIRIPGLPQWSWLTMTSSEEAHADGWIDRSYGAQGNLLYVNRGIGFSDVPIRINTAPELTVFTLRSSDRLPPPMRERSEN